jgi:sugar phosphate isomerase/epimerase
MKEVGEKNVGTLPDFNNFCLTRQGNKCVEEYDKYKGTFEMLPYAKAVSAKSLDFDAQGNCIETDYVKMLKIVKDSGFKGYVGIEYEGDKVGEYEGIKKTKALLERVRAEIG